MSKGTDAVAERSRQINAAGGSVADGMRKELATKLAWAVGSTLHVAYGKKGPLGDWAVRMSSRLYEQRFEMLDGPRGARRSPTSGRERSKQDSE